jgi:two-component system, OmpR family, sensor histidine kinase BaeS
MRLHLANQFALVITLSALAITLMVGGLLLWTVRDGFSAYLRAQDEGWLNHFCKVAERIVEREGVAALEGPPSKLAVIMRAMREPSQWIPSNKPREREGPPLDPTSDRPPPPRADVGGSSSGLGPHGERLSILTPDGKLLSGRPTYPKRGALSQAIVVRGQTVAVAWIHAGHASDEAVDAGFLTRIYGGLAVAALLALAFSAAVAVWVSRRWTGSIAAAQIATRRIAAGEFDVRLDPVGGDELAMLMQDVNVMASSLQSLESSRKRWIAELSHELRTPLTVLRAEIEALIDGVRQSDALSLASLEQELTRLTRLADDFHQLATSELRALPIRCAEINVCEFVRRTADRSAQLLAKNHITLQLDESGVSPTLTAQWDADRITQLFDNLLLNSVRYTDAPGRIEIQLRFDEAAAQVQLSFDDTPPGVVEAELARLFEPLYRADASRSRTTGGSGLGLAICQALVRSHGGSITARRSRLGGLGLDLALPLLPPLPVADITEAQNHVE